MPSTGQVLMSARRRRWLASSPLPATRVILEAQALSATTFLVFKSIIAMALFSCSVTHAVFESCDTAMYSGSRSCATLAPGPKIRIDESSVAVLNAEKPMSVTTAAPTPPRRSIRLTLPSGSNR